VIREHVLYIWYSYHRDLCPVGCVDASHFCIVLDANEIFVFVEVEVLGAVRSADLVVEWGGEL